MLRTIPAVIAALLSLLLVLGPVLGQTAAFLELFDGKPAQPTPYSNPNGWDFLAQGVNVGSVAQHGPNCEPPGFPYTTSNTHPIRSPLDAVFLCNDHLMTTLGNTGYGAVYMTPPAVADFSAGQAVIRWDQSTLRTAARDWTDLVLTPWAEHSQMAYNNNDQHIPRNNIHITLAGTNVYLLYERIGGGSAYGQGQDIQIASDVTTTWDMVFQANGLTESPVRRDTFELTLTRTTISLCMPNYQYQGQQPFCWARNAVLPQPLDPAVWHDQAAVQINHRTYNPLKSCADLNDPAGVAYAETHCPPDTWHWDNVSINPYVPYTIVPSVPRDFVQHTGNAVWTFAQPAPAGAFLGFTYFGDTPTLRVSYDGHSFHAPRIQPQTAPSSENGEYIADPIPAGVQQVTVTSGNGFWGTVEVIDAAIYGPPRVGGVPTSVPTATSVPGTSTPPAVVSTPEPRPTNVFPTDTPTPMPQEGATETPTPTSAATPTVGLPTPVVGVCSLSITIRDNRLIVEPTPCS